MSPGNSTGYSAVLRTPGALRAFVPACLGRLSFATLSLALLLTVEEATGSFAVAGAAVGTCALGSGVMPIKSRLVDRRGSRHVLPVLASVHAAALLSIAAGAVVDVGVATTHVALSGVAGLAAPPLGPSMRALWAELTPDLSDRRRAYSLDTVSEEVLFTVGPLLVAATIAVSGPSGPVATLILTAVLNVFGTVGLATAAATPPVSGHSRRPVTAVASPLLGPLHDRRFAGLLLAVLGVGLGGGPLEMAVLARTQDAGSPETGGILLAVLSASSVVGGLLWGRREHRRSPSVHLIGLVLVMTTGTAAAAVTDDLRLFGLELILMGLVTAPTFVVAYLVADHLAPAAGRTEATTWVSTANNVGVALGAAAAGVLIERSGPSTSLLAAAAVLALTALVVLSTAGRLGAPEPVGQDRRTSRPPAPV